MDDFILYFKMGLTHVLDFSAYDHILFLIVLAVIFTNFQWRKVIWLVTLFTLGHSITLALSAYKILEVRMDLIEFLIPLTIFITGLINIINAKKEANKSGNINLILALFFGLIHGLGFSNYFKMMIMGAEDKLAPLLGFAGGIEISQVIIVLLVLVLAYVVQTILKVKQSIFILVGSILIILITLPLLYETFPF